ncbi:MAG TPA: helix-turn-helix transcriptional regulator [Terriglobales bacterium]|nr:helix-turn-helix transcriptional regulator [Terriglobales bacterium]
MSETGWGQRIRSLREHVGWSGTRFGRYLGVSQMAISRWERGRHPPPAEAWIALGILAAEHGRVEDCWYFLEQAGLSQEVLKSLFESVPVGAGVGRRQGAASWYAGPVRKSSRVGGRTTDEAAEQLHAALDIILDRAPSTVAEAVAAQLTRLAGKYGQEK